MDNIKLKDLREVATLKEIAKAFGVTHPLIINWEKTTGDIPEKYRYRYSKGLLPDGKKSALALYKRALKNIREKKCA